MDSLNSIKNVPYSNRSVGVRTYFYPIDSVLLTNSSLDSIPQRFRRTIELRGRNIVTRCRKSGSLSRTIASYGEVSVDNRCHDAVTGNIGSYCSAMAYSQV